MCITDTLLLHHNDPRLTGLLPVYFQVLSFYERQVSVKAQGPTLSQPKAQDTVPLFNCNYSMLVLFQQHCQGESSGSSNLSDVGLGACIFND